METLTNTLKGIARAIKDKAKYQKTMTAQEFGSNLFGLSEAYLTGSMVDLTGQGLKAIKKIEVRGENVRTIKSNAFTNMSSVTEIEIGSEVTGIESNAFTYCTGLTSIHIPSNVTTIAGGILTGCSAIETITVDSGNANYRSEGNAIIKKDGDVIVQGCKTTEFSDNIKGIERLAFQAIPIKTVILPDSVISMGNDAFASSGVTYVVLSPNLSIIPQNAFFNCGSLVSVEIPNGVTTITKNAFYLCGSLQKVEFPESIAIIGDAAFHGCKIVSQYDFSACDKDNPPQFGTGVFGGDQLEGWKIIIPDDSYDIWSDATNLGDYADKMYYTDGSKAELTT